jgi:seryl-tRNA synthetase
MDVLGDEKILKEIISQNNLRVSAKPFEPILPPPLIKTEVYDATARLNSAEMTYKLADEELWLNASAEHSLAPMYMDEILTEEELPIRYLGYATSFRREAGNYGKDMEGIFRLHHFDKLEMVSFSTPETSYDEHLLMIALQEYLLQQLGISYQVVLKCTADIGHPNARGMDINAWMPAQYAYRETHTADLITDYQARRLKTRFRRSADGKIELAHNNDATALALGRMIKAIVENYQNEDGSISPPSVLEPYLAKGKT